MIHKLPLVPCNAFWYAAIFRYRTIGFPINLIRAYPKRALLGHVIYIIWMRIFFFWEDTFIILCIFRPNFYVILYAIIYHFVQFMFLSMDFTLRIRHEILLFFFL